MPYNVSCVCIYRVNHLCPDTLALYVLLVADLSTGTV